MARTTSGVRALGAGLLMLALLSGCADGPSLPKIGDLNPFKETLYAAH